MIYVIVSESCPACIKQKTAMTDSFFEDEYKVIFAGSEEFKEYENIVDAVPFLIIKDDQGNVKYKSLGFHDGQQLRQIEAGIRLGSS